MEDYLDFKEFVVALNKHKVEYLIVGAHALAHLGCPRLTGDLDVLVRPTTENGNRIVAALDDFGVATLGFKPTEFAEPGAVFQIGVQPVRIDLMTEISGVTWEEAQAGREEGLFENEPTYFVGREQFIANKRSLGRPKDLADIDVITKK